jgi:hypothetical protein
MLFLLLVPLVSSECSRPCYKVCRTLSPSSACEALCTCHFAWRTTTSQDSDDSPVHKHRHISKDWDDMALEAGNLQESSGKGMELRGKCEKMCLFGEDCDVYCTIYLGFSSFSSILPFSLLLPVCFCFLVNRRKADSAIDPSPLLSRSPYP